MKTKNKLLISFFLILNIFIFNIEYLTASTFNGIGNDFFEYTENQLDNMDNNFSNDMNIPQMDINVPMFDNDLMNGFDASDGLSYNQDTITNVTIDSIELFDNYDLVTSGMIDTLEISTLIFNETDEMTGTNNLADMFTTDNNTDLFSDVFSDTVKDFDTLLDSFNGTDSLLNMDSENLINFGEDMMQAGFFSEDLLQQNIDLLEQERLEELDNKSDNTNNNSDMNYLEDDLDSNANKSETTFPEENNNFDSLQTIGTDDIVGE